MLTGRGDGGEGARAGLGPGGAGRGWRDAGGGA